MEINLVKLTLKKSCERSAKQGVLEAGESARWRQNFVEFFLRGSPRSRFRAKIWTASSCHEDGELPCCEGLSDMEGTSNKVYQYKAHLHWHNYIYHRGSDSVTNSVINHTANQNSYKALISPGLKHIYMVCCIKALVLMDVA